MSVLLASSVFTLIVDGAQISLTSQPQTSGTYCPGPVTFTCVGTQIGISLFWQMNGSDVAMYTYQVSHEFPYHLIVNPPHIEGVISSASFNSSTSTINITSILNVSNVTYLNGTSLQCADFQMNSGLTIQVSMLGKLLC